jgi:hypothetical protein
MPAGDIQERGKELRNRRSAGKFIRLRSVILGAIEFAAKMRHSCQREKKKGTPAMPAGRGENELKLQPPDSSP